MEAVHPVTGQPLHSNKPAWTGIGYKTNAKTSREALDLANLDWDVKMGRAEFVAGMPPLTYTYPDKFVTYRTPRNTPIPLGMVGPKYRVLQNRDAFALCDELVGTGEATYESAGMLGNGRRVWMLARLKEDMVIRAAGGEDISRRFLLFLNSHDGSSAVEIVPTDMRVTCSNMLNRIRRAGAKHSYKVMHTAGMGGKLDEIRSIFAAFRKEDLISQAAVQRMADTSLTDLKLGEIVDELWHFDPDTENEKVRDAHYDRSERIQRLFRAGLGSSLAQDTRWGGLNAITAYVDHVMTETATPENRFKSVLLGKGAIIKRAAFSALYVPIQA